MPCFALGFSVSFTSASRGQGAGDGTTFTNAQVSGQSVQSSKTVGFSVSVAGKTDLVGGQITSTQAAIDNNKNSYQAQGGTSTRDLNNSASFEASSVSVGLGAGTPKPGASLSAGLSGVGIGSDSGSASSTTTAGISGIAGNTAARTGDADTGIKPIFNQDEARREVNAQVVITSEFGRKAIPLAAKTADDKAVDLRREGKEDEAQKWDEGGTYRTALYTLIGGLGGGSSGAVGALTNATLVPVVGEEIAKLNLPEPVREVLTLAASVTIAAATGGSEGVSAAVPQTAYNYVSHSPFAQVRRSVSQENARLMNLCGANCTEQDMRRIDQQMAKLEAAGNLAMISQNSKLTTEQALQLGELVASLHPLYGTPIALYQAISGKGAVTQSELSDVERFFNGVAAAIPVGSAAYKLLSSAAVQTQVTATLTASAERALANSGGRLDRSGNALIDMSKLSNEQKGLMGDLFGANTVKQIVPDGQKIARIPGVGEQGLDDLYKVNRPDVDYVNIEYKFVGDPKKVEVDPMNPTRMSDNGSDRLGKTNDGLQGSTTWIGGSNRIEKAVGSLDDARAVRAALESGRVESWVVTVRPDGSTAVEVLDALGKPKPIDQSKIILPNVNPTGVQK